ncbi:MAG: hypothetical protein HYV27_03035 [Candidatus Hydrogenedentes bacterium]|nr:hypothetical protein [Candidatus Hydrogenedentota bacterium]
MHVEILVEDGSGGKLLEQLVPKILDAEKVLHTWRIHSYKGIGRVPAGLMPKADPSKRILLDQLARILKGYANTPGIDAIAVVLDVDRKDCIAFLAELNALVPRSERTIKVMFRLAIEEMEAWYLGDRLALFCAYPRGKKNVLNRYVQDSVCGTWEVLADVIYPGGSAAIRKRGWPLPGQLKHEWAEKIGPLMGVEFNDSKSFCKFRDGLRRLVAES